jgi:SAM-dependent methyltransferase
MKDRPPPGTSREVPGFPPDRCAAYLEGTEGAPPRPLLVEALPAIRSSGRRALDLGCGPGREVVALLEAGFEVTAVDPYPIMLERTRALVEARVPAGLARVRLVEATLEEWADGTERGPFDLVHAGFVLPFVVEHAFERCFARMRAALAPGGVLVAQFFGPDDEFIRGAAPGTMTAHDAREVDRLLEGLEILSREEVNREGQIGRGRTKWWHVHHVVARRPSGTNS